MDCKQVEDLISMYIESEVTEETHREISTHLELCSSCRRLKEKVEDLLYVFPELEEEVPFFLKNRLYYIPESQEVEEIPEGRYYYMKWVAAAVGTFVLFLNLFYFTNIYPPANRLLHTLVSKVETFAVETGAFFERVKESKGLSIFSLFKSDSEDNQESDMDIGPEPEPGPGEQEKKELKEDSKAPTPGKTGDTINRETGDEKEKIKKKNGKTANSNSNEEIRRQKWLNNMS
jgi:hypothetical protein